MKIGLIATLGTRDIVIERNLLEEKFGQEATRPLYFQQNERQVFMARPGGEFLLKNFQQIFSSIKYPILEPALNWLYQKHGNLDTIILVGTDQKADHIPEKFKNNDTVFFARIFQKLIPKKYKKQQTEFDVRVKLIEKEVVYLDSMYAQISKIIRAKPFSDLQDFDEVYLLNQGGIDAINMALLLNGLNAFGKRLRLLSVNESTQSCGPLNFPAKYLKERTKTKLESYLKTYNYAAIKSLEVSEDIKSLAAYAEHRLNFDFQKSVFNISQLSQNDLKDRLIMEVREIESDEFQLLREVYLNAKIKFKQEAYVDFLFRMFRIVEGLTKYYACGNIGLDFQIHSWGYDIETILNNPENEHLKDFLESYTLDDKGKNKLDLERTPTIPVWLAILEFFDENTARFLKDISRLADLRNHSIGAHSFNPVSIHLIEETLAGKGMNTQRLFERLDDIFDPRLTFDQINQWISTAMEES